VTPFPKGHVAIATSWSDNRSACALHTRFGEGNWRGPVRFHLDLEDALLRQQIETAKPKPKSSPRKKPKASAKTGAPKKAKSREKTEKARKTPSAAKAKAPKKPNG
jgi:hypothetical protein